MTKQRFIQRLRFALWGGFSRSERRDVVADFESFFVQGQANGLDETDIITEIGDPTTIALDLADESGKSAPFGALIQMHTGTIRLFVGVIIFFGAAFIFHFMRSYQYGAGALVVGGVICAVIMILPLYFALKPNITTLHFREKYSAIIPPNAVLFALAVSCGLFFNSGASLRFAFWAIENSPWRWLTNGLTEIRMLALLIAAGIGVWAVADVWCGKVECFIAAAHAVVFFVYLETVYKLWAAISDFSIYWEKIASISLVYAVGIMLIMVLSFVLSRRNGYPNGASNRKASKPEANGPEKRAVKNDWHD